MMFFAIKLRFLNSFIRAAAVARAVARATPQLRHSAVQRRHGVSDLLGEMKDEGSCVGNYMDKPPVQSSFRNIIQNKLGEIKAVWNSHRIQATRNHNVPSGIPDVMFTLPQLWESENFIVSHNDLDVCKQACKFLSVVPCDKDIFDSCSIIMSELDLIFPKNISEAQEFYLALREASHTLIFN